MPIDPSELPSHLFDYRFPKLVVVCAVCRRRGVYKVETLKRRYYNYDLAGLPRRIAADGGCPLAMKFPGHDCDARFEIEARQHEYVLGEVHNLGWVLHLACERHHQAMKSTKPCPGTTVLDVQSLVAAYGHDMKIEKLQRLLCCPRCGSKLFSVMWMVPSEAPAKRA